MTHTRLAGLVLRLRLALRGLSPVLFLAVLLYGAGFGTLAWLVPARDALEQERALARRAAAQPPPAAPVVQVASAGQNLALFYDSLGEKRYVEQQVKTLFGIAAKTGLVLRQGEYKSGYDRNAKLYTYQVNLPVQGSYGQVWQFAMLSLRAIPFASLDDISFRRDTIGQANVEARLRLSFYLLDKPGVPR